MMKDRQRKILVLAIALFVGALFLTLLYGDLLREHLLRPVLYRLWLFWLQLHGLPFDPIWTIFIGLAALAVYLGIVDLLLQSDSSRTRPQKPLSTGPVLALVRQIKLSAHGELARWNFSHHLSNLVIAWIALHDNIPESEARRRFTSLPAFARWRELLMLNFPNPNSRSLRRLSNREFLHELDRVLTELEDYARYGRRGTR
ncbi:MAG: hypothetical protein NZ610_04115 [Candidatus Bipolaricaulota bacterium]|nr:hypothetical protein [Candidatus Bipolaricaulota bacterium]MCS7274576.1 hypothetical protein [Candidatus Bipolaricaulota bacterium]MDW8110993.1 hypothetical protein [Candidatus Bipolaricaulota bacterium]MDW8329006.1 hypothetical protein [Candidatus Bipolaricaulota bacterium]